MGNSRFDSWYAESHPTPPTAGQSTFRFMLGVVIVAGVITLANKPSILPSSTQTAYEVISVYKGAVQVRDKSGNQKDLHDEDLVKKALSGQLKKGDTIYVD